LTMLGGGPVLAVPSKMSHWGDSYITQKVVHKPFHVRYVDLCTIFGQAVDDMWRSRRSKRVWSIWVWPNICYFQTCLFLARHACTVLYSVRIAKVSVRIPSRFVFFNYAPHLFENSALPIFHLEILTYVSIPGEYVDHIRTTF
jgi:hypothetical protein